jgi:lipopolysaccharide export system protein LptC
MTRVASAPVAYLSSAWLRVRRAWDRVAIYLPIILMGLMAMSTYWLVRISPEALQSDLVAEPRHVPDYFMRDFSVRVFDASGKLKSEISGALAKHFPDTDTLEIEQPHIRTYSSDGRLTVAQAGRALTNADGSEVQLFDNAVVVRERNDKGPSQARTELRSDFFHIVVNTEELRTHLPVELKRGDFEKFSADKMTYDHLSSTLELKGRVRGVLIPKKNNDHAR